MDAVGTLLEFVGTKCCLLIFLVLRDVGRVRQNQTVGH